MKLLSIAFLLMILVLSSSAQPSDNAKTSTDRRYRFSSLPASPDFRGKPHAPILTTPRARTYLTQISNQAKRGPNFAGHFTVAHWGCGSPCLAFAIVDARTGDVYDPGFTVGCSDNTRMEAAVDFRLGSRLIIATGFSEGLGCGRGYYEWNGRTLNLFYFKPWNYGHRSDRKIQLPRYMTDIEQPIPPELKIPGAPSTARRAECFVGFTRSNSVLDVVRKCGVPDEHQGSGLFIFVYDMDDGSVVVMGTADLKRIIYLDHLAGKTGESLLKKGSSDSSQR